VGAALPMRDATLADHRVVRQAETALPLLQVHRGGRCPGVLIEQLTPAQKARLDAYEIPFGYRLAPVTVETASGPVSAEAYFPQSGIPASEDVWSLDDWVRTDLATSREAAREFGATVETLGIDVIVANWHMILHRAMARVRAGEIETPATLRYRPEAGDAETVGEEALAGTFFRLASYGVRHRRFDGKTSPVLRREVLVGADAALVLPYDPARGQVLLVEQFRAGVFRHGNPNPWTLEPVAGIVDAGETPEEAARRETGEEAGLTLSGLERMFAIYPSPGSSTDYFHCFLGIADLSESARFGGLAGEDEDIRLHLVTLDDALALIETGEINVGPLVAMLYWLARHRVRIDALA
jgi:nudix-type nucleoside diphosphatase (YffH/AdpP family)